MKTSVFFSVLFITIFVTFDVFAQCAMCKATSESSGFSTAGLNKGILYLMSIPYIAFILIVYFWWKQSKKTREQQKQIIEKLKKNISN